MTDPTTTDPRDTEPREHRCFISGQHSAHDWTATAMGLRQPEHGVLLRCPGTDPTPAPSADLIPPEQDLAALAAYEAATGERGSLPGMHAALAAAAVAARPAGPVSPLQVGAKVQINACHPTMPAAGVVKRNHGRTGTVVQSYGQGYTDDRPRLVDLDDDRGTVLVNTLYLHELAPASPAGPLLGEEPRRIAAKALMAEIGGSAATVQQQADAVLTKLEPHVVAVVTAAEQRGAAAERERIPEVRRECVDVYALRLLEAARRLNREMTWYDIQAGLRSLARQWSERVVPRDGPS